MRRTRKKVLLTLLLLAAMALLFFYYAFVHSGLGSEPRLTARDFHDFHPAPAAVDTGAGAGWLGRAAGDDSSLEEVKSLLEQLEHQQGIDRLAKDARALATAPAPTHRRPRIAHRFSGGSELIRIDTEADADAEADDTDSLPLRSVEAAEEAFARAATDVRASCQPHQRFGPKGDGGWSVCLAGPYRPLAGGCLSVSFGVGNIWSFDDQVATQLRCRVLAFDPSLTDVANHTRPGSGVEFYRLGLHSKRGRYRGWPVDSLQGLLDSLAGGPGATVDLLKLDIEGAEWPALEAALASGTLQRRVKQLALELHSKEARPWPNADTEVADYASYLGTMRRLQAAGFRMWLSEPNDAGFYYSRGGTRRRRLCCYNAHFINARFLPQVNASQLAMEDRLLTGLHSVRLHLPLRLPDVSAHRASPQLAERLYFDLMSAVHADCPDWRRLGPEQGDSGYDVCLSGPFALRPRGDCLVYSFGVADQYGFEDQLAGREFECRVRMFDPSLTQLGEHKRGPRQWVHLVGLGAVDEERADTGWQVSSLQTLLRRFGNEVDTLDLVKVDIELDEWPALEAATADRSLARVKQLIVETHTKELRGAGQVTGPGDYLRFVRTWLGLYRLGFRQWRSRENPRSHFVSPTGRHRPCCHEHSLVNINFL